MKDYFRRDTWRKWQRACHRWLVHSVCSTSPWICRCSSPDQFNVISMHKYSLNHPGSLTAICHLLIWWLTSAWASSPHHIHIYTVTYFTSCIHSFLYGIIVRFHWHCCRKCNRCTLERRVSVLRTGAHSLPLSLWFSHIVSRVPQNRRHIHRTSRRLHTPARKEKEWL